MINFRVFSTLRFPRFICLFVLCAVRVGEPNNEIAPELMQEISDKLKNSDGTKQETVVYIFFHLRWHWRVSLSVRLLQKGAAQKSHF